MSDELTIDLSAPVRNYIVEQGGSYTLPFAISRNGQPFDLTNYLLRLQVRDGHQGPVVINCTLANGKLGWTDQGGGLLFWALKPEDTSFSGNPKIEFEDGKDSKEYVYDLEIITPTNVVFKPCKGTLTVNAEATK